METYKTLQTVQLFYIKLQNTSRKSGVLSEFHREIQGSAARAERRSPAVEGQPLLGDSCEAAILGGDARKPRHWPLHPHQHFKSGSHRSEPGLMTQLVLTLSSSVELLGPAASAAEAWQVLCYQLQQLSGMGQRLESTGAGRRGTQCWVAGLQHPAAQTQPGAPPGYFYSSHQLLWAFNEAEDFV